MSTKSLSRWWLASRYHFVPPSFLPAILGGVIAWASLGKFSRWYFLLVLIGVIVNHFGLNMTDDYYDYKHSIDTLKPGERNPYSGGSGTLTSGMIAPREMFGVFVPRYLVTIAIGLYLTVERGWPILPFGMFGLFCSIFYTAPPIKFAYRGWGEEEYAIVIGGTAEGENRCSS